jgi:hypothetical protein
LLSGAKFWPASAAGRGVAHRRSVAPKNRAGRAAAYNNDVEDLQVDSSVEISTSVGHTSKCRHFLRRSRSYQSEFFLILTILAQIKFGESLAYVLKKAVRLDHHHCQASTGMESQAMKLHI